MAKSLRVLIVENNEVDLGLMLAQLRRGDYVIDHQCVASAAAMQVAIECDTWDVVISAYALPGFSGIAALQLVAERGLGVPFILCAGTIEVITAVEMMKRGAHDYVSKANLGRLLPAVERALGKTRSRFKGAFDLASGGMGRLGSEIDRQSLDGAIRGRGVDAHNRNDQGYFQAQGRP